ncbi:type II toxin-antitoxin system HicA family toxin [Peptococcus simiae]|uniref:hypothetical protein n=1 Tax=Peptococcus simiae TaxID=1643805 RepID=UPI00397EEC24
MSKKEKLLAGIRNNPKDVSFQDLDSLLRSAGFIRRQSSKGSSHYTYSHTRLVEILTVPKSKPVKAYIVKEALRSYDLVMENNED